MERNRLRGSEGDNNIAQLRAAGTNFAKLLKHIAKHWREFLRADIRGFFPNETLQPISHILRAA